MPKIEVNESLFFNLLGRACGPEELERILPSAKAELDGWDLASGAKPGDSGAASRSIKIELNDTNRPDLWSTAGLARQLRLAEGGKRPEYPFFSWEGAPKPASKKVVVEESVNLRVKAKQSAVAPAIWRWCPTARRPEAPASCRARFLRRRR